MKIFDISESIIISTVIVTVISLVRDSSSADFPTVQKIKCRSLLYAPSNGSMLCRETNDVTDCTFACDVGFHLTGAETSVCLNSDGDDEGKWSNPAPICERILCKTLLTAPKNGTMKCTDGNSLLSFCEFSCNEGYWMSGSTLSVCIWGGRKSKGRWSELAPRCSNRCRVNLTWYENGEEFDHWFLNSPCKFVCTCIIKNVRGKWFPTASCVHRCPKFSYPPGCTPVSDGCCAKTHVCPDGEKCQDEITGVLYGIGETWNFNDTCECECLGEGVGRYRCICYDFVPVPTLGEEEDEKVGGGPCDPDDDSQSCSSCPIGVISCSVRAMCEKWPHEFEGIPMECTCHGRNGTRCVAVKAQRQVAKATLGGGEERRKRSVSRRLYGVTYSEGWKIMWNRRR